MVGTWEVRESPLIFGRQVLRCPRKDGSCTGRPELLGGGGVIFAGKGLGGFRV